MDPSTLIPQLRDVLSLTHAATLERHPAGVVNSVYRLKDNNRTYAVKWVGDDTFSGVDRFQQYVLQQQLAERGVAPKPIWLSDDELIWVEDWEDNSESHTSQRTPQALAYVLAHIHSLPITSKPLNLYERWLHYIQVAGLSEGDKLYESAMQLRLSAMKSERDSDEQVLCHNDLFAHHILQATTPVIVDWEYAAMGNRYFDVAACAKINGMDEAQTLALSTSYALVTSKDKDEVVAQVNHHMKLVNVTNDLWVCAFEATK